MKTNRPFPRRPLARQMKGFSLIEFLVASTLSMIVLIAVSSGYFVSRQLSDTALARLNVQQDLRNASNMIVRDARMAGSFGCFNMSAYPTTAVHESSSDTAAFNLIRPDQNSLVPVKQLPAANMGFPDGFTAASEALVFQYGVGSASITNQNSGGATLQIPAGDPLRSATATTPLVFSSCGVLDRPATYTVVRNNDGLTISNINPALSAEQVASEFSVLRYTVNAYVVGTAGEQQGLFRFQLADNGGWGNPQLLMPDIGSMDIEYGYVYCANGGAASAVASTGGETFEFTDTLKTGNDNEGNDVPTPALIRMTLNSGSMAVTTAASMAAGDVHIYNIDATVRGGNTCADRTITI
ncbi:MAG: prepilin-type N-terminal cleavage/methylation domain-containing protein [Neisseria sp.]|nr:prepilin-type N-terminal cleavage/methylation domain-containing protein [Neisseria sp.]